MVCEWVGTSSQSNSLQHHLRSTLTPFVRLFRVHLNMRLVASAIAARGPASHQVSFKNFISSIVCHRNRASGSKSGSRDVDRAEQLHRYWQPCSLFPRLPSRHRTSRLCPCTWSGISVAKNESFPIQLHDKWLALP